MSRPWYTKRRIIFSAVIVALLMILVILMGTILGVVKKSSLLNPGTTREYLYHS